MSIVGVPREAGGGERRVALVPASVGALSKVGVQVIVERGAGEAAGFPDARYAEAGARVVARDEVFAQADVITSVSQDARVEALREGQALIAFLDPLSKPEVVKALAARKVMAFSMELMPRITRAQSMDALSAMATLAGYKAVIVASDTLPRFFPMLTTAAGSYPPAKVLVIGAGVAGLQAIATARRLGAIVSAYDVRPAAKDQVESVGARFVELALDTSAAEDKGGYAKALGEDFYRRQRELLGSVVKESDVVITTAAVPGKKSPVLVTAEMVAMMAPGSVIVDLAALGGGNCELTRANEVVVAHGVTVLGPTNLPSTVPNHASQMYARNVVTFLTHLIKDGSLRTDIADDEIARETCVTRGGEIVHPRVRDALASAGR